MNDAHAMETRLAFVGMNSETRAVLRALAPLIAKELPRILDQFYAQVARFPETAKFFANKAHMDAAKQAQSVTGRPSPLPTSMKGYVAGVVKIGESHHRIGLEPRWYNGGYTFILSGLLRAIEMSAAEGWRNGQAVRENKAALQNAICKAALLDMDLSISIYLQRGAEEAAAAVRKEAIEGRQREEAERKSTMHDLADRFETAVGNVIAAVSSTSNELERAAATPDQNGRYHAGACHRRCGGIGAGLRQRTVGSIGDRADGFLGLGNRPAGQRLRQDRARRRQAGGGDRRAHCRAFQGRRTHRRRRQAEITSVAEQTNLLALNATIEAARAGEAGRGFAVVAQEVKALAAQTAKATDEIGSHISGMQLATEESVKAIKQIGGTISQISTIASAIAAAVEQQGAATREIARNVNEAAKGTVQVASNIADVNRGAIETGSASGRVLSSAKSLSTESGRLKVEVEKFIRSVRTGPADRRESDDPKYRGPERRHHDLDEGFATKRAS